MGNFCHSTISSPPINSLLLSYVVLSATLSTFIGQWHSINTGKYRKAAKIPYPNAYASAADAKDNKALHLFNCAQRAHVNYLEHHSVFLVGLLIGGLKYPMVSAGLGLSWCLARVMYTLGYTSESKPDGKGRSAGTWFWLPEIGE